MTELRADVPYGVLDLFVLKTLDAMGPLHGFGLATAAIVALFLEATP